MEIGQGIFKDCPALVQIIDEHGDEQDPKTEDISYLNALSDLHAVIWQHDLRQFAAEGKCPVLDLHL